MDCFLCFKWIIKELVIHIAWYQRVDFISLSVKSQNLISRTNDHDEVWVKPLEFYEYSLDALALIYTCFYAHTLIL